MNNTKKKKQTDLYRQQKTKKKKKQSIGKWKIEKQVQRWQGNFTKIMTQHQC
jgi:hypothetical protein